MLKKLKRGRVIKKKQKRSLLKTLTEDPLFLSITLGSEPGKLFFTDRRHGNITKIILNKRLKSVPVNTTRESKKTTGKSNVLPEKGLTGP
jgi:hypothetical protein